MFNASTRKIFNESIVKMFKIAKQSTASTNGLQPFCNASTMKLCRYMSSSTNYYAFYKLLNNEELYCFMANDKFYGTKNDRKRGCIHLSTNESQLGRIKEKYYPNVPTYKIALDAKKLMPDIKLVNNGEYAHYTGKALLSEDLLYIRPYHTKR